MRRSRSPVARPSRAGPPGGTTPMRARSRTSPRKSCTTRTGGYFVADDGTRLNPGFNAGVGFANFREVLSDSEFRVRSCACSPGTSRSPSARSSYTFAFGLLLAVVFNDVRMKGRKVYRSLLIIPYALPGFMTALVWQGMFNETFGVNRWLPFDVVVAVVDRLGDVLADPREPVARLPVHVPRQHRRAAEHPHRAQGGGARRRRHRLHGVPQDHVPAAAGGGRARCSSPASRSTSTTSRSSGCSPTATRATTGESAGETDILLSWAYRVALDASPQRQGLAAALSVLIFLIVAVISALGFKYTKTFEEVR